MAHTRLLASIDHRVETRPDFELNEQAQRDAGPNEPIARAQVLVAPLGKQEYVDAALGFIFW